MSLLTNYLKKKETIFIPGDFNINLLNYDIHLPADEFLDSLFISLLSSPWLQLTPKH